MRSKFTGPKSETLTLTHGEESITLTLVAPPVGYASFVEAMLPDPVRTTFVNGKPVESADPRAAEFRDLRFYLMLAKALEPSGELEAARKGEGAGAWEAYARAVHAELQAAGFADEDHIHLMRAIGRLRFGTSLDEAEGAPGNA